MTITNISFADYKDDLDAMRNDMPSDVVEYIERRVDCNHWMGEYAYDSGRKLEIDVAVKELKCDDLLKQEKHLSKKYRKNTKVIESIKAAREYVLWDSITIY